MIGEYSPALLAATLASPLALLAACLSRRARAVMPWLAVFAPLPGFLASLLAVNGAPLVLGHGRVRLAFALDLPGALLLGTSALLWMGAGLYAASSPRGPNGGRFTACWLLALTGSLAVFIVADLVGFYLALALLSFGAGGLIVHEETPGAWRAGGVYLGLALLGETLLLLGFVLLAAVAPGKSLLIRDAVAALAASPWRDPTLALLLAGFGLKAALVPLHFWMPLAYPAAPIPAAAALSGAAVKASLVGLIRFLPFDLALPGWGDPLAALGLLTAFYGVLVGITQANPKAVLAYSSVSQMGLLIAVLGKGLATGAGGAALAAAFYAANHVLVKGALFLAVGVAAMAGARRWTVLAPAAVLALGLGGLPLTGGALAKFGVKGPLGEGLVGTLAIVSAIGSTLLMLHFVSRLRSSAAPEPGSAPPLGPMLSWLAVALAAFAVPWTLYLGIAVPRGLLESVFTARALWDALWPILVGVAASFLLERRGRELPPVPEGDVAVVLDAWSRKAAARSRLFEDADALLRRWPAASLALMLLAAALGGAMLAAGR